VRVRTASTLQLRQSRRALATKRCRARVATWPHHHLPHLLAYHIMCPLHLPQHPHTRRPAHVLQELKRQQEDDEARQEEARLAAEQARLAAQFQSEQDAERGRRSSKQQPDNDQQQGSAAGAGVRSGGAELQTSKSEGRRRVSGEWQQQPATCSCCSIRKRGLLYGGLEAVILVGAGTSLCD
jgi:hypothetical protein